MGNDTVLSKLTADLLRDGERDLATYLGLTGDRPYTGASFEHYGTNDPSRITSDDLIATTMLSIPFGTMRKGLAGWTPQHALAIEREAGQINDLLHRIPAGAELASLGLEEAEELVAWEGNASPGRELYELLRRGLGTQHPPGRVAVYKLLTRKRPGLFAVRDSVVEKLVGHTQPDAWWMPSWHTFQQRPDVVDRLREIRASVPETLRPTLLRTADIALWMAGNH